VFILPPQLLIFWIMTDYSKILIFIFLYMLQRLWEIDDSAESVLMNFGNLGF
jgi:hypothetical protein